MAWFTRYIKWILGDERSSRLGWFSSSSFIDGRNTEFVFRPFAEIVEVVFSDIDRVLCDLGPSGAVSRSSLDDVSSDWRPAVELWSLPGQLTGSLGEVIDLEVDWWTWWV